MQYWAFISYSHSNAKAAKRLHHAVESYRLPRELVGRPSDRGALPGKLFPVFLDHEELSGQPDLREGLRSALEDSQTLIVLCSPESAGSRYVNEEIRYFQKLGRGDRIFCVIHSGEPEARRRGFDVRTECIPEALAGEGQAVPLAADLREGKDTETRAVAKLVAGVLGISFADLWQRERRRARMRRKIRAAVWTGVLATSSAVYVSLSDMGYQMPWSDEIRTLVDSHQCSLFRPVSEIDEIASANLRVNARSLENVDGMRLDTGFYKPDIHPPEAIPEQVLAQDVWSTSQALAANTLAADSIRRRNPMHAETVSALIEANSAVRVGGSFCGWRASNPVPQPEITCWAMYGISGAGAAGVLGNSDEDALGDVRHAFDVLAPTDIGNSWPSFVGQVRPELADVYVSTLALLAMLNHPEPEIVLGGKTLKTDEAIRGTCGFLLKVFIHRGTEGGWNREAVATDELEDGLTLQVATALLLAEKRGVISIPPAINEAIYNRLVSCIDRPVDYPLAMAEVGRDVLIDGKRTYLTEAVTFDWLPWAIASGALWLSRDGRTSHSELREYRIRRMLTDLLVRRGEEFASKPRSERCWRSAELAIGTNIAAREFEELRRKNAR